MTEERQRPAGADFARGDIVGNTYEILDYIGRGAMGYVYHARHVTLRKEYALKTLSAEQVSDVAWKRFQIEARVIAKMFHPNLVGIHNFGVHQVSDTVSLPFYVMDLLAGRNLMECLRDDGPPPLHQALSIFIQAASGLGYAHSKGVVHRDVKPGNIVLLPRADASGATVKIVDFGIAKLTADKEIERQRLTSDGEIFGSPFYMSPEQSLGLPLDARSDIYSLGVAFYETLAGDTPFNGKSALEIMLMHQSEPTPQINAALESGEYPAAVQAIIDKMMAKTPADRYQAMEQVSSDMNAVLNGALPHFCYVELIEPSSNMAGDDYFDDEYDDENEVDDETGEVESDSFDEAVADGSAGELSATGYSEDAAPPEAALDQSAAGKGMQAVIAISALTCVVLGAAFFISKNATERGSAGVDTNKKIAKAVGARDVSGAGRLADGQKIAAAGGGADAVAGEKDKKRKDFDPEEDKEPTTSLNEKAPYAEILSDGKNNYRVFRFPKDVLIGKIFFYNWLTYKDKTIKARGKVKKVFGDWTRFIPSRLIEKYPQYLQRFREGDMSAVQIVPGSESDDILAACTLIPGIEEVTISDTTKLTPAIYESLDKFKQLLAFDGARSTITGIMLAKADCWKEIRKLYLSEVKDLSPLLTKVKVSPQLYLVDVRKCDLTYYDYKVIAQYPDLKELDLSENKISNRELSQLEKAKKLTILRLVDCKLEPDATDVLRRFKGLKTIYIESSHLTIKERDRWKAVLPGIEIK